jgi:type IV pilus assembly protein PilE
MKKQLGFTLLELMIVVAVIAILAALALTSYRNQILKSKRAEGKQVISDLALRQEKWRLNNATYASTLGGVAGPPPTGLLYSGGAGAMATKSPSGYYNITLSTPAATPVCPGTGATPSSANSFRITATATGDQAEDTDCATIVITSLCGTVQKTSTGGGNCW